MQQIGLISDTHGLLRPQAVRALSGVQQIIHAGDIGEGVLEALGQIAPVAAIRGNNDKGTWAAHIPETLEIRVAGVRIHVVHDVKAMTLDPAAAGFDVVISGHSHKPSVTERDGVCFVNPGSAGPRRFSLPVTVAYLELGGKSRVAARILEIL
jgi:putative phosphoesterase